MLALRGIIFLFYYYFIVFFTKLCDFYCFLLSVGIVLIWEVSARHREKPKVCQIQCNLYGIKVIHALLWFVWLVVFYKFVTWRLEDTIVKPLLSGPPIKRTPSIKWTLSWSRNERLIFPFIMNPYSADTSIKWTWTLK